MELHLQKSDAIILMLGSIFFLIAAFLPSSKVFSVADPQEKMKIITDMHSIWVLSCILFMAGSLITAFGIGIHIPKFKALNQVNLGYFGAACILTGAILWSWHVYERIINPEGFVHGTNTPYLFLIYSLLTQLGFLLFGYLLLSSSLPDWTGLMMIIGGSAIFLIMVVFGDMPPFVYYLLTLILAIKLYLT